ncbi:hypothetical protein ACFLU8_02070 [Chloroflexota bacterium]
MREAVNKLDDKPNNSRKKSPGLHWLVCESCGAEKEVESGIRVMFCCAQKMKEV